MKLSKIYALSLLILVVLVAAFFVQAPEKKSPTPPPTPLSETEEVPSENSEVDWWNGPCPEDDAENRSGFCPAKDFVEHARTALSSFEKGSTEGIFALEGSLTLENLEKYRNVISEDFNLVDWQGAVFGGIEMAVEFPKAPGENFYIWVYRLADGSFELRGFDRLE